MGLGIHAPFTKRADLRDSLGSSRKGLAEYSIWVSRHLNLGSLTTRCMKVCRYSESFFDAIFPFAIRGQSIVFRYIEPGGLLGDGRGTIRAALILGLFRDELRVGTYCHLALRGERGISVVHEDTPSRLLNVTVLLESMSNGSTHSTMMGSFTVGTRRLNTLIKGFNLVSIGRDHRNGNDISCTFAACVQDCCKLVTTSTNYPMAVNLSRPYVDLLRRFHIGNGVRYSRSLAVTSGYSA